MKRTLLRVIAVVMLTAALSPGVWWREAVDIDRYAPVTIAALPVAGQRVGPFAVTGAWHIASRGTAFGGYSALAIRTDGTLMAASDGGRMLFLRRDEKGDPVAARLDRFLRLPGADKRFFDTESMTRDPGDGRIWTGSEFSNALTRLAPDLTVERRVRPREMAGWGLNSGPEAMVRLADGRFIVIEEGSESLFTGDHRALLYPGDPTLPDAVPLQFRVVRQGGLVPVDMAQLPDGRVLVLLRGLPLSFPPRFPVALAIADPAAIRAGESWPLRILARLDDSVPRDNYEALAVEAVRGGGLSLWLVSDDNQMRDWQRSILLRLDWDGGDAKRARGPAARP